MAAEAPHTRRQKRADQPGCMLITVLGLLITISLPILALMMPTPLGYFNWKIYDEFLMHTKQGRVSGRIVIVDVDDDSLRRHGQWPWPRYKIAAIVNRLNRAGAAVIVLDMVFPEKDRTSLATLRDDLRYDLNLSIDFQTTAALPDNDRLLADSIAHSPVVLGYQFLFDTPSEPCECKLHALNLSCSDDAMEALRFPLAATQAACNLDEFAVNAHRSGFFNVSPDADGILRSVPMIMKYKNKIYPSLALATVMKVLDLEGIGMMRRFDDPFLVLGRTIVPLDARGNMLVRYRGKAGTYRYVSAADLLAGRVPQASFKDKIVFLGISAAGLKELRTTPIDALFPGVEVHATVVDNLLSAGFLSRPASAPGIELMLAFLCGILYVFAAGKGGALRSLTLALVGTAFLVATSFQLFKTKGVFISPILPLLVLVADFAMLNLLKFWHEELKARQRAHDLALAQGALIESLASLTETRDPETGEHIKRTQEYVRLLARALQRHPDFKSQLTDETVDLLCKSAPLHDIGKVGIPDEILLKPGKLSTAEFEQMKMHAVIGRDVIASIQRRLGERSFLAIAHDIIYTHHEKWDGSGYPRGLKGEEIPLSGRLMAIADMYDALISRRVYKEAMPHDQAVQVMTESAAASFDPRIFQAFLEIQQELNEVARRLADTIPIPHPEWIERFPVASDGESSR